MNYITVLCVDQEGKDVPVCDFVDLFLLFVDCFDCIFYE